MDNIYLLDCTLRDGAYIVESKFGSPAIKGIIDKLQKANVDIIECGWLKDAEHTYGTSFYHIPSDLEQYLISKNKNVTYVAMIDWNRYDVSVLPEYDGKSIDAIRVVFPFGKYKEGIEIGQKIREKGYKVFFQAANTLEYSEKDLIDLAKAINDFCPVGLSVVDTFGAMFEEDLEGIIDTLEAALNPEIMLGFHSHNNQQLSFSLTTHFIKLLKNSKRKIIIDSSLCGMGRGAGNATTELVASYLNRKCNGHYDLDEIMDAIDIYMTYFQENYSWGYSTPYFISGQYCCHVNNISYLINKHHTSAKDMRNIISSLSPEDRRKYDYDLLEQKYIENQNRIIDDSKDFDNLKKAIGNKEVLLIAPGKTSISDQSRINAYIEKKHPFVIGVNSILKGFEYDSVFFVNPTRYEYAKNSYKEEFDKFNHIVLSNIKSKSSENEYIINYNSVIHRGWPYFDNAVICCLYLLERIGIENITIAGFDGFKTKYNESYADHLLPSLNLNGNWDELNKEILEMFNHFKKITENCKNIKFLTFSIFDK